MKKFFAFFLFVLIFTTSAFSNQTDDIFSFKESTVSSTVAKEKQIPTIKVAVQEDEILTVPFMTHIPYFSVYVNVLPDKDVVVTEKLFLVLSEDQNTPFVRSYPLSYVNTQENKIQNKMEFIGSAYNKKSVFPRIHKTDSEIQLIFSEQGGLSKGVHLFEISYTIPKAVVLHENSAKLFLPILGSSLSYMAEKVQILVIYPPKSTLTEMQAVFGANNLVNEDAYDMYTEKENHLMYKIKGILPKMVDVRLDISSDSKGFETIYLDDKIDDNLNRFGWIIVSLICSVVLFLYFKFTAFDIRNSMQKSKFLMKVRSKLSYDIGMLRWLCMRKADTRSLFAVIIHLLQKDLISIHFNEDEQITLIQKENIKPKSYEKNMLSFIFGKFKKERNVSNWVLSQKKMEKFKKVVLKNIWWQKTQILQREILVGALLPLIAVLVSVLLSYSMIQIFGQLVITLVAYMLCANHFIRKSKMDVLMRQLFEEYVEHPLNEAKQREVDIALERGDHSQDVDLLIMSKGKRLPLSDFEQMFFAQISA